MSLLRISREKDERTPEEIRREIIGLQIERDQRSRELKKQQQELSALRRNSLNEFMKMQHDLTELRAELKEGRKEAEKPNRSIIPDCDYALSKAIRYLNHAIQKLR